MNLGASSAPNIFTKYLDTYVRGIYLALDDV
jgi:hypothetical protein